MHILQRSVALGKPCRRFQPCTSCLGVFDEDVYHLATNSAASCRDNRLGSKLPRIARVHRSEALGGPIHHQLLRNKKIPVSYE